MSAEYGRTRLMLLGIVLLLAGCSALTVERDPDYQLIRGTVRPSPEGFYITPCYSHQPRQLTASAQVQARYQQLAVSSGLPVYMELWAKPLPNLDWQVSDVQMAGASVQACRFSLAGIRFRAAGSQPLWVADLLPDSIRVRSYEQLRTLKFPLDEQQSRLGVWTGTLQGTNNNTHQLRLEIRDTPCLDEHQNWYRWRAYMTLDKRSFSGCARQGDLSSRSVKGRYSNELDTQQVFVVLDLLDQQQARMLLDYRNGQPLIVVIGQWRWQSETTLLVEFSAQDGRSRQSFLLLERTPRGFRQQGFSSYFGRSGITLERSE